ncbi:hypothetical protein [Flavobacterium proteolyticum]|jgi:hypothetical protein|uniref:Uncharacterized protein n=1 Tax=Flavobacterium proteolyticum TaxID=2911683 RepID=A0ABR9WSS6_9FLAO|nr:hypothetical protein [Flavobacterium proteolyticum]MBE9576863.1 hypothetical protein [Flavobacterium proteolyticum]
MTQEPIIKTPIPAKNNKGTMLVLSLLFDFIGMVSYFVPVFAEVTDLFWAPISGILLVVMFKGTAGKLAGVFGFIEELLPFVDVIPTFTITWFYTYVIRGGKGQE